MKTALLFLTLLLPASAVNIYTAEERAERAAYAVREAVDRAPLVIVVQTERSLYRKQALAEAAGGNVLCRYSAEHEGRITEVLKGTSSATRFVWKTGGAAPMPAPTPQEEQGISVEKNEERVLVVTDSCTENGVLHIREIAPLQEKSPDMVRAYLRGTAP